MTDLLREDDASLFVVVLPGERREEDDALRAVLPLLFGEGVGVSVLIDPSAAALGLRRVEAGAVGTTLCIRVSFGTVPVVLGAGVVTGAFRGDAHEAWVLDRGARRRILVDQPVAASKAPWVGKPREPGGLEQLLVGEEVLNGCNVAARHREVVGWGRGLWERRKKDD